MGAHGGHIGLAVGLPLGREFHQLQREDRHIGHIGRQGRGGQQVHGCLDALGLGLAGGLLLGLGADAGLHGAIKAQQAGDVVGRAPGQGGAAVVLALCVGEFDHRRPFAGLVDVDLVGAVGVVFVVARCVVAVVPAELERAAPGLAVVHAGLAGAYPDVALPPAVAVAVPPVVVLVGEHGQAGEVLDVLRRQRGHQALVERVARAVLAHGLAHVVKHAAPGGLAGLPGVGVGVLGQRLPFAGFALTVAAVQQRELWRGGHAAAQHRGRQPLQQALGRRRLLDREVEVPGFPDGDEHVVVALVAVFVHMPLADRKVGLLEPAIGLVLLVRDDRRVHHGQDVRHADAVVGAQVVRQRPGGLDVCAAVHRAVASSHGGHHLGAVQHGGQAVLARVRPVVALGGKHGAQHLARELCQVRHGAHLIKQKLHLLGACDVQVVFVGEQRHAGLQPAVHAQLAVVVVAPQQVLHPQCALHMHQLPADHGVVHLGVAGDDEVGGAVGVVAGQRAVDAQVAVHQDEKKRTGDGRVVRAGLQALPPAALRAAAGQRGVQVQLGPLHVAGDPQHGFIGQRGGVLRQALGHPAVGGNQGGHIGQRAKSGSGHWALKWWCQWRGIVHAGHAAAALRGQ